MVPTRMPRVRTSVDPVRLGGGVDLISPSGMSRAGMCRFALNYEQEFGGGYRRVGGFERYDGRPSPSAAQYDVLEASAGFTVTLGMTVTGSVSSAEGKVVWISPDLLRIGLTRLLPGFSFQTGENVMVGGSSKGTITNASPSIDSFLDNDIAYLAAEEYRVPIQQPPGSGPIRGVAILKSIVYCWRDNGSALGLYKATSAGWVAVPLNFLVTFTGGSAEYVDGGTIVQGGVAATILRVVHLSGEWTASDAAGYMVVAEPVGGNFTAGAAAGTGAAVLGGAQSPITLAAGGRVETVVYNFYASEDKVRLYGCDGVNQEFEFDGTVWTPIVTGMGTIRARHVAAHKKHLFYAYRGSAQHSGIGSPYRWSTLFGAAELGMGDEITGFRQTSGSESNAALMIACRDSLHVLYGATAADWNPVKVSDEAGAQRYSMQLMGGMLVFDRDGFNHYRAVQEFGNFSFESASLTIEPLVAGATVSASVLVKDRSMYRCFFSDGTFVTGTPWGEGIAWMPCSYDRGINVAIGGEINGKYRVFVGDFLGWVLETDAGRSFDGAAVSAGMRMTSLNQGSDLDAKQYRQMALTLRTESAFHLSVGFEYSDTDPELAAVTQSGMIERHKQYGMGLYWDFGQWDRAYWDGSSTGQPRFDANGKGQCIVPLFQTESDRELPHTLQVANITYSSRVLTR